MAKSITVWRRGEPIHFLSRFDEDTDAEFHLSKLVQENILTSGFARDLASPAKKPLSRGQLDWCHFLIHEYEEHEKTKHETYLNIVEMFGSAINKGAKRIVVRSENLKFSVTFRDRFGNPIQKISIKNHRTNTWYAYLLMDGTLDRNVPLEVREELLSIEEDPFAYARRYGHLTGNCMFCGLQLTHKASIHFGYGPICAEKFGRPHSYDASFPSR